MSVLRLRIMIIVATLTTRGSIWRTTNGGVTWTKQVVPDNASILNRIDFVNANNGWAVGVKFIGYGDFDDPQHVGTVYRTTNGGQTWVEQFNLNIPVTLTSVDFIDALNGWAVGFGHYVGYDDGSAFQTTDGGVTWKQVDIGDFCDSLWDVHFLDKTRGYVVGNNYGAAFGPSVARTLDGGITWQTINIDRYLKYFNFLLYFFYH